MSGKNCAGKGDSYRKLDQKKWDEGWEKAFGKKKKKPQTKKESKNEKH
jgi:hypothetical protein|tara:strand:+ start:652 stop:795 length:144 start_codon:yes stop_codon:yes gene_type:complete